MNLLDMIEKIDEGCKSPSSFLSQSVLKTFLGTLSDSYKESEYESSLKKRMIESDIINPLP